MSSRHRRAVHGQRCCLLLLPGIALAVAATTAHAAEPMSVQRVKTRLEQQQGRIQSLQLRIRRVTTLSVERELLESWPDAAALPNHLGTDEVLIAFKGEKRYFRVLELDYHPPPYRGPAIQEPRPPSQYLDESTAWTGKVLLQRDRDPERGRGTIFDFRFRTLPAENARDCFSPPPYLRSVGLAVPDPTGQDPSRRNVQQMHFLPELLGRWPYAVAEKTESIDGADCVVLEGSFPCELPLGNGSARRRVDDRLWLDLEHGLAMRKRETRIDGQLLRVANRDFVEVLPGFWLPKQSVTETWAPPQAPKRFRDGPVMTRQSSLCFWLVNQAADDTFDVALTPWTDEGNPLDRVPAFHKRSFPSPHADSQADEKWREEWAVRGVGRREETRQGSELVTLEVDTPRWHFVWTPKRNVVTAWPSRLGRGSVATGKNRAQIVRSAEFWQAMIACRRERLEGQEVERLTAHYPWDVGHYSWPTPLHDWDPRAQRSVSGTDFLTRTWWFDPKTDWYVGRRCGCIKPGARTEPKTENPPPDFTIDYPAPETVPRALFTFEVPRGARLGISDPELGREIWSEGEPEPGSRE